MTDAPRVVVLYSIGSGSRQPVAEFRWSPGTDVSLTVLDPKWAGVAQDDYDEGISSDAQHRVVPHDEPEAFMRALVEPRQAGYYHYVDETDRKAEGDSP
jgi:hypothetical protein